MTNSVNKDRHLFLNPSVLCWRSRYGVLLDSNLRIWSSPVSIMYVCYAKCLCHPNPLLSFKLYRNKRKREDRLKQINVFPKMLSWLLASVCVLSVSVYNHGFHSRRSCPVCWIAPMSLWLYFRTLCCSKGQIKKHRNPHKAEGGGDGWSRVNMDIHKPRHISEAQGSADRGSKVEQSKAKRGLCEEDSPLTEWKHSRKAGRDHIAALEF